jgi:beta-glucosidase/6-phospho-beta-glucosidase/beta-galactosidase
MRVFSRIMACLAMLASLVVTASPVSAADQVAPLPDDFLWGVSSSGFQSEGSNPDSNWLRYSEKKEAVGDAVDFRHRYAEDIALAAEMGVEVYRFGIEWARVEPAPGEWDEAELAYYDDVVHVYWIQRAREDGIDVIGYNYWSLTDNYEWGSYTPRFGLYTVDALTDPTLARLPTDGVDAYTGVIANGGVAGDYDPVVRQSICSLIDPPLSCLVPAS